MNLGNRYLTDDTLTVGLPETHFTALGILLEIFKRFCFSDVVFREPIHELQKSSRKYNFYRKIISMAEISVIGSDLIHSFLSIRYIRKAQRDRHMALGPQDSNTAKM